MTPWLDAREWPILSLKRSDFSLRLTTAGKAVVNSYSSKSAELSSFASKRKCSYCRHYALPIGREHGSPDIAGMALQFRDHLAGGGIPHPRRPVPAGRHHALLSAAGSGACDRMKHSHTRIALEAAGRMGVGEQRAVHAAVWPAPPLTARVRGRASRLRSSSNCRQKHRTANGTNSRRGQGPARNPLAATPPPCAS
jgi:hypothetical protein